MQVQQVTISDYSDTVSLSAVYGGSTNKEDNSYAAATPSGRLELQVSNPEVRGLFKPGQKFYVDLTEVPPPPAVQK